MFLKVAEFHRKFGGPIATERALPLDKASRHLRIALLAEEFKEYLAADQSSDRVAMADGLADMLVIIAGTAVTYGFAPNEPFRSPYDEGCPGVYNEMTWSEILWSVDNESLTELFKWYLLGEAFDDLDIIEINLTALVEEIFLRARQLNFPINVIFDEVHRSNMSKLGEDGKPVVRADGKILKGPNYFPPDIARILAQHNV